MNYLLNVVIGLFGLIGLNNMVLAQDTDPEHSERTYQEIEGSRGVPLLVMEMGDENMPPILFIHGMSQSHLSWQRQFESELAEKYHLVAFDMRGHGGSAKPWNESDYAGSQIWAGDVAAVIDGLGLKNVTIVGWSFGGFVAVSYIRHYGTGNVRALNLVGNLGGLIEIEHRRSPEYDKILEGSKLRRSLNIAENIQGYREMPRSFTALPMTKADEEIAFVTGLMNPSYVRRAMKDLPLKNQDMVAKMSVPVLISLGSEDMEWPAEIGNKLAKELPDGRVSIYEKAGHFPSFEYPQRFDKELDQLIKSTMK